MINCEIELDLKWSRNCVISEIARTLEINADPDANLLVLDAAATETNNATFQINNAKHYVAGVTLSIKDSIKFLENIKQGFQRTVSWSKYRSKIITKPEDNNLDYMMDKTFKNINRLLVL